MNERRLQIILLVAGTVLVFAFSLAPFFYMALVSFSADHEFLAHGVEFEPTADHYEAVLTGSSLHFLDYLRNSLIVSALSAAGAVMFSALAAFAITRLALPGKLGILFFVLIVSMFPQIGIVGYLFKLMSSLGWINTYMALVLPYIAWTLPLSLWVLVGYFSQIPRELDIAATVDGCNRWQILWRIIIPVAAPGMFSVFLLAFIFAFNEFMFALMLTTDASARTVPVGIALFQGLHGQTPWGDIMAASVITTLPVIVLALIFQRRIISGLTQGAVKG